MLISNLTNVYFCHSSTLFHSIEYLTNQRDCLHHSFTFLKMIRNPSSSAEAGVVLGCSVSCSFLGQLGPENLALRTFKVKHDYPPVSGQAVEAVGLAFADNPEHFEASVNGLEPGSWEAGQQFCLVALSPRQHRESSDQVGRW